MVKKVLYAVFFLLFIPALVYAGVTGKIAGRVIEKDTGSPLPGANIVIEGTTMGAATDINGNYFVVGVPPGTYSVSASMIGYQKVTVHNIRVYPDFTATVNFDLSSMVLELGGAVEVVAERPLIQKDQTASVRTWDAEETKNMPVRGYQGIAAINSGVVSFDDPNVDGGNAIYIRGGRLEETGYFVDGFLQQDPLTGSTTTSINNNAIEQVVVITGGFNAEYGKIMSGLVNVVTKGGGKKYFGSAEVISDNFTDDLGLKTNSFGYENYDLAFGGPVFPGMDWLTFYFSGERRYRRDREPRAGVEITEWEKNYYHELYDTIDVNLANEFIRELEAGRLPRNSLSGWTWQGKLNFRVSNSISILAGFLGSSDKWQDYLHTYRYNLNHCRKFSDFNNSYFVKLTHTLGPSTFYTFSGNYFVTSRFRGDGVYNKKLPSYAKPQGNTETDDEALFRLPGWAWDDYLMRKSSYYGVDFDITSQVTPHHQLQAGFEVQRHTLRRYRHLFPVLYWKGFSGGAFNDVDWYGYDWYRVGDDGFIVEQDTSRLNSAKHPITASIYLQDKIEYQGLVINAGIRYDYLSSDTKALKREDRPLDPEEIGSSTLDESDLVPANVWHKFSPRLGVGFPVTDRTLFHLSYGKFFQLPMLQNLYVSYDYLEYKIKIGGYYFGFGNPNLQPETTTAYEVGFTQQMSDNLRFDVTAYYKDVKNLIQVSNIASVPNNFSSFRNKDYGTIKGIDFSLNLRRTHNISANIAYSLSWATGTGSTDQTQRNIAWTAERPPKLTAPLAFDQRHRLSVNVDYRTEADQGPELAGFKPLEKTGVNLLFNAGSGFPYTPTFIFNEVSLRALATKPRGPINSSYGPWTYRLDMKMDRTVSVGPLDLDFYVWVLNVLNRKNAVNVYSSTGQPNTTGWLATPEGQKFLQDYGEEGLMKYNIAQNNPQNYDIPRQIRFGVLINF